MADSVEFPYVSEHAGRRWYQRRSTDPGYGPVIAWNRAHPLPESHGIRCDEARYHPETDTVLVAKHDSHRDQPVLVTVYSVEGAKPSVREAVAEVAGS